MLGLLALPARGTLSRAAGGAANLIAKSAMGIGGLFAKSRSLGSVAARSGNYGGAFGFPKARDFAAKTAHNVATTGMRRFRHMAMGQGVAGKVTNIAGLGLPVIARGTVRAGIRAGQNVWSVGAVGAGALTFGMGIGAVQGYYGQPQWNPPLPGNYKGAGRGMGPDHLGTQGLTQALHKTRHR